MKQTIITYKISKQIHLNCSKDIYNITHIFILKFYFLKSQLMKKHFYYVNFSSKIPLLNVEFHSILLSIVINIFNRLKKIIIRTCES